MLSANCDNIICGLFKSMLAMPISPLASPLPSTTATMIDGAWADTAEDVAGDSQHEEHIWMLMAAYSSFMEDLKVLSLVAFMSFVYSLIMSSIHAHNVSGADAHVVPLSHSMNTQLPCHVSFHGHILFSVSWVPLVLPSGVVSSCCLDLVQLL